MTTWLAFVQPRGSTRTVSEGVLDTTYLTGVSHFFKADGYCNDPVTLVRIWRPRGPWHLIIGGAQQSNTATVGKVSYLGPWPLFFGSCGSKSQTIHHWQTDVSMPVQDACNFAHTVWCAQKGAHWWNAIYSVPFRGGSPSRSVLRSRSLHYLDWFLINHEASSGWHWIWLSVLSSQPLAWQAVLRIVFT